MEIETVEIMFLPKMTKGKQRKNKGQIKMQLPKCPLAKFGQTFRINKNKSREKMPKLCVEAQKEFDIVIQFLVYF